MSAFKFTPVRMGCPHDNLTMALGILQSALLATDHKWNADIVLGKEQFHHSEPLQAVLSLLMPLIETVNDQDWEAPHVDA